MLIECKSIRKCKCYRDGRDSPLFFTDAQLECGSLAWVASSILGVEVRAGDTLETSSLENYCVQPKQWDPQSCKLPREGGPCRITNRRSGYRGANYMRQWLRDS